MPSTQQQKKSEKKNQKEAKQQAKLQEKKEKQHDKDKKAYERECEKRANQTRKDYANNEIVRAKALHELLKEDEAKCVDPYPYSDARPKTVEYVDETVETG